MKVQDEILDLTDVKQIKKPDLADLESYLQQKHPYSQKHQKYTRCQACSFQTGCHSCLIGETTFKSQVDQLGLTPTLYFRFVKNIALWFFLFSLVAVVPILFYAKAFTESSTRVKQFTASEKLTSTTLGALVIDRTQCQYLRLDSSSAAKNQDDQTLMLSCSSGTLPEEISNFFYGLVISSDSNNSANSCIFQDISYIDQSCNAVDTSKLSDLIKDKCFGKSSCEVKIDSSIFSSDSTCQTKANKKKIFFSTFCDNASYQINWKFEKSQAVIIASVIDAAIMICFMFALIKLRMSQEETEKNVISNSIGVSYFTLEFTNLPQDFPPEELKYRLQIHLDKIKKILKGNETFKVYDIQLATSNNIICSEKRILDLQKKKIKCVLNYCTKFSIEQQNNQVSMTLINNHYNNIQNYEIRNEATKILTEMAKIQSLIDRERMIVKNMQKHDDNEIQAAFVTFETMRNRDIAYYSMYQTNLDKLIESCFFCCKNKDDMRRFEDKLLNVRIAPSPEDIIWENFSLSFCSKLFRRLISLFITIVFLIGSNYLILLRRIYLNNTTSSWMIIKILTLFFNSQKALILIVYVKKQNKSFTDKYPVINCPNNSSSLTKADIVQDYESPVSKGLLECYCKIDTFGRYDDVFTMSDGSTERLCKQWFEDQTIILILPFMVVLVIIIINFIMQHIFTYLSKFEGYRYVSYQISSRVAKIFFMQFMNTALIILIMNTKFDGNSNSTVSYLLDGTFTDFTPLWFKQVGSTILLTMIFYIIMPYINFFMYNTYLSLKQCYDRRWSSDKKVTRCATQEEYEKVYLGPNFLVEVRYAQIMNIIFVCFLYSAGLPALIVTSFLFLLSTYYIDKFAMLRVCRKPPQYGKNLEDIVRTILWVAVPLHCLLSIWMLGSPKMFAGSIQNDILGKISSQVSSFEDQFSQYNQDVAKDFFNRAVKSQCIPQLITLLLFLLYIIYLIIKKRIIIPLFNCICCCFSFAEDDLISKKNELSLIPIHAFITKQDLKAFLKILAKKIEDCQSDKYKDILQAKYQEISQAALRRKKTYSKHAHLEQLEKEKNINCNLVGAYSYDIELHPDYI